MMPAGAVLQRVVDDSSSLCRFTLSGRLDAASAAALWRSAPVQFDACDGELVIDLSGVEHSDSAGVALLVDWLRQTRTQQRVMQLCEIPEQMRAIIRVADLEVLFGLDRSRPPTTE